MEEMSSEGSAVDATIHAFPAEEVVEGSVDPSHEIYLAEAKDAVVRAHVKLEGAQAEVIHAEEIVKNAEALVASLEGGI